MQLTCSSLTLIAPHSFCIGFLFLVVLSCTSCKKTSSHQSGDNRGLTPIELEYPAYIPKPVIPSDNPLTKEGVNLGRQFYYDTLLSNNGKSCGSCHIQQESFSSIQVNSLAHINLGWSQYFLWNGGVEGGLENAMIFEVDDFFKTDISRLNQSQSYRAQVQKVFQSDTITTRHVSYALAQFIRSLNSFNNRIDRYMRKELMLSFSELNGLYIFNSEKGECFHCHTIGLYHDNQFHNTGLDDSYNATNQGRFDITGDPADLGKYKTPGLRNVALTSPYMHDGRFSTLEQVIEFYNSGVKKPPNLDPIMTKPSFEHGLQLSTQQKSDLIAFLHALTDSSFLTNPTFSQP